MQGMMLLPPRPDVCQQCAVDHARELPHNQQSLFWQYWFFGQYGKWPTWLDAMAHCTEDVKQKWIEALKEHGIDVKGGERFGQKTTDPHDGEFIPDDSNSEVR